MARFGSVVCFPQFDPADPTNLCVAIESSLITTTPNHCPHVLPPTPPPIITTRHSSQEDSHYSAPALNASTRPESPSLRSLPSRMVQFLQSTSWPTVPRPTLFPELLVRPPLHFLCGVDESHLSYDGALTYRSPFADNLHLAAFPPTTYVKPQPNSSTDQSVSSAPQKTLCNPPRARLSDG